MEASFLEPCDPVECHIWQSRVRHEACCGGASLGLEDATPVVTPVAKRPKSEELQLLAGPKPLNAEDTSLYRSVTMRVN